MSQAPYEVSISIPDLPQAQAVLRGVGPALEQEVERAVLSSILLLHRQTQENTSVGIGGGAGLRGSIAGKGPRRSGAEILGIVTSPLVYALPVELGTKPHMPPVTPLIDWAERKLDLPRKLAERVGWAIAKSIAKKGTKGVFMFTRALATHELQVIRMFEQAVEQAVDRALGGEA